MGRDERVDHDGYAEQESEDVARQLTDAAQMFSNVLDRLGTKTPCRAAAWRTAGVIERPRTQRYSWPARLPARWCHAEVGA